MHKLIEVSVFAAIGVLVFASLLIPVVDDATATTDDFNNTGYFFMEKYGTDTDVTISWDPTDPKKITVNDVEYAPNTPVNTFVNLAVADNWFIRYADGGANTYLQVSRGGFPVIETSQNATTGVTITCSEGTATMVYGTNTYDATYTEIYVISGNAGTYVMKNSNESVYMAGNTEFVALGITPMGTGRALLKVTGNVDDGANVEIVASQPAGATSTNIVVNATPIDSHKGYVLTTVTFDIVVNDTEYPATYSYFVVPSVVELERSVHADEPTRDILAVLPLILICALIMGVVGFAVYSRIE